MKTTLTAVTWISFHFNSSKIQNDILHSFCYCNSNIDSLKSLEFWNVHNPAWQWPHVGSEQVTLFWHFFISISIFHTDKIYNSVHSITSQCLGEPPLKYLHSPQVAWNYRPANLMQRSSQLSLSVVLPNEKWQPRNKLLLRGCTSHLLSQFGSTSVILTSNTL